MLIFKNGIFLLISFYFNGAFPLQQSPQNTQPSFVSPWSFVPAVSVGTQELAGLGAGEGSCPYIPMPGQRGWSCCVPVLLPGGFLDAVSRGGLQKVTKKINLLTGDLGSACSECFALTT